MKSITCGELLEKARGAALSLPCVGEAASGFMTKHLVNESSIDDASCLSNGRCAEITNGLFTDHPGLFNIDTINNLMREVSAES